MKRILMLLSAMLILSFGACGSREDSVQDVVNPTENVQAVPEAPEASDVPDVPDYVTA